MRQQKSFTGTSKDQAEGSAGAWAAAQRSPVTNIELQTFFRRAGLNDRLRKERDTWTCVMRFDASGIAASGRRV
jgi:hypothetical protein